MQNRYTKLDPVNGGNNFLFMIIKYLKRLVDNFNSLIDNEDNYFGKVYTFNKTINVSEDEYVEFNVPIKPQSTVKFVSIDVGNLQGVDLNIKTDSFSKTYTIDSDAFNINDNQLIFKNPSMDTKYIQINFTNNKPDRYTQVYLNISYYTDN